MADQPKITLVEPSARPNATKAVARAGQKVILKASPRTGTWTKDRHEVPAPHQVVDSDEASTLSLIMDQHGELAGIYEYTIDGRSSNALTVDRRGRLASVLAGVGPWLLVIVYILLVVFTFQLKNLPRAPRAYFFAGVTVGIALLLVDRAARSVPGGGGLKGLFMGADRRASTSKTQYMLWTIGIAFALAYIGAWAVMNTSANKGNFQCQAPSGKGGDQTAMVSDHNCVDGAHWQEYLILLGVPIGAAVLAKGVTTAKVDGGTIQKTSDATGAFNVADLPTDDSGKADIVDVQYLIFNVITFVYVAWRFVATGVLGEVPAILLGLTSTSAGAYVLNKSLQTNVPRITGVSPSVIWAHAAVTITGSNLFPAGQDGESDPRAVKIAGLAAPVRSLDKAKGEITTEAPLGMPSGDQKVTVITAAGVETEGFPVKVVAGLRIVGLSAATVKPNDEIRILVEGLPADAKPQDLTVLVGGVAAEPNLSDNKRSLSIRIPEGLEPDEPNILVRYAGEASNEMPVKLTNPVAT